MILAILMVLGAGIFRLAAHEFQWWNIAPLAAMALVGGMYLGRRFALWVPLAVLVLTDLILNVQMGYPAFYWPRAFDYGDARGARCRGRGACSRSRSSPATPGSGD